jgi:hypothetical protein
LGVSDTFRVVVLDVYIVRLGVWCWWCIVIVTCVKTCCRELKIEIDTSGDRLRDICSKEGVNGYGHFVGAREQSLNVYN